MADCHEVLLGAGKGSQDAHACLPGHAHTSSLVLWDGLPVPLRVLSLGCQPGGHACRRGVHSERAGCVHLLLCQCWGSVRGPHAGAPPSCLPPRSLLMLFPVPMAPCLAATTQPTLKSPTWLFNKPLVRAELAFPKFPQHICGALSLFQTELICGRLHPQGPQTRCSRQAC